MIDHPEQDETIAVGKTWVFDHLRDGVKCPCCEQKARVYKEVLEYLEVQTP